nr:magnesium-chelatase subunit ChlD, chloroplastic isoform X2 [Ipomoea batatas]
MALISCCFAKNYDNLPKMTDHIVHLGHRAELYAARVAKCLAALEGREKANVDDLKKAVELVILPRSIISENPPDQQNQQPPPPPPPQNQDSSEEQNEEEDQEEDKDEENEQQQEQIPEEFIFDAEGGLVDEKLLFFAQQAQRRKGKAGRAKNVIFSEDRGRYIKPMLPKAVRVGMNAEKSGDVGRIMIVAITDGRANISLKRSTDPEAAASSDAPRPSAQELKDEILEVAGKIYKAGMSLLVIDTENKFVSTGFAKEIAKIAQGKYYYLPNASDAVISATTRDALAALKSS